MGIASETFDFLERVGSSNSPAYISRILHTEAEKLGFTGLVMSWLPPPGSRDRVQMQAVGMPVEFFERYAENHYERYSPIVHHMATSTVPFRWDQVSYDPIRQPMAHKIMRESWEFGIRSGWTIPIYLDDRLTGWISAASSTILEPTEQLRQLHLMGLWAHARVRSLTESGIGLGPQLSPREREVVSWLSNGKTADQIAGILNVSSRTVEYHIANAGNKLGTSNRIHTVVEAIRLKQISI